MKITLVLLIFCMSCTYMTGEKTETGTVIEKQYVPEIDASGTTYTYGKGGGFGTAHVHENEKYILVFKCQHGSIFPINDPELYAKLQKSDTVVIRYREERKKSDSSIVDFDFITADKYAYP